MEVILYVSFIHVFKQPKFLVLVSFISGSSDHFCIYWHCPWYFPVSPEHLWLSLPPLSLIYFKSIFNRTNCQVELNGMKSLNSYGSQSEVHRSVGPELTGELRLKSQALSQATKVRSLNWGAQDLCSTSPPCDLAVLSSLRTIILQHRIRLSLFGFFLPEVALLFLLEIPPCSHWDWSDVLTSTISLLIPRLSIFLAPLVSGV